MGKIVVITGGTSGIGLVLKNLFEQNGDTIITFSLDDIQSPNHYIGSVDHEIKVKQVFNDIYNKYGKIDILINGAGIGMSAITEIVPIEQIHKVMDVNFYGTLYCTRSALPYMKSGSRIVNMSSAMALFPVPFRSIYGASKSAVLNLSMSLRMELAPLGIDVVAICPGNTKTNFTKNRIKDFTTTDRYGDRLQIATLTSDANEDKRMSAEEVGQQIFKQITKPKTKPYYIIGGKYKFLHFLTRITPKSLLINITGKKMGGIVKKQPVKDQPQEVQPEETIQQSEDIAINNENTIDDSQPQINNQPDEVVSTENTTEIIPENTETENPKINDILSRITILNRPKDDDQE